jgi:hypothetical protein
MGRITVIASAALDAFVSILDRIETDLESPPLEPLGVGARIRRQRQPGNIVPEKHQLIETSQVPTASV